MTYDLRHASLISNPFNGNSNNKWIASQNAALRSDENCFELRDRSHLCYKSIINYDLDIANFLVISPQIRYIEVFDLTNKFGRSPATSLNRGSTVSALLVKTFVRNIMKVRIRGNPRTISNLNRLFWMDNWKWRNLSKMAGLNKSRRETSSDEKHNLRYFSFCFTPSAVVCRLSIVFFIDSELNETIPLKFPRCYSLIFTRKTFRGWKTTQLFGEYF